MKKCRILASAVGLAAACVLANASFLARPRGTLQVLAHRGMHQRFDPTGVDNDTCTATRIHPPTHPYLENTIAGIGRAFELGADMVEIDVHPTQDGDFAVFHDWTLECRTDGEGEIGAYTMDALRRLDVGYGYTADGKSFPFRGTGIGQMPDLREVLRAFPDRRFMINFKSRTAAEGDAMCTYLASFPEATPERLVFFGAEPALRVHELRPDWRVINEGVLKRCALGYMLVGWSGLVPSACRNTIMFVPVNYASVAWGWPNRLLARMHGVGSDVFLAGPAPWGRRPVFTGIDDAPAWSLVPRDWRGGVSTDAIEVVGPLARSRQAP